MANIQGIKNKIIEERIKKVENIEPLDIKEKIRTIQEGVAEAMDGGVARQKVLEKIAQAEKGAPGAAAVISGAQQRLIQRQKEIEKLLETGLEEIYLSMSPEKQKEFARAGEETAREINNLLSKTKFKIKKIIELIKRWLAFIPGVNKFFLEQEAKIKADEIIKMKNKI